MANTATYTGKVPFEKFYKGMGLLTNDPRIKFDEAHETITITARHDAKTKMVIHVDDLDVGLGGLTGTVTGAVITISGKTALTFSGLHADASGLQAAAADSTALYQYLNEAVAGDGIGTGDKYANYFEVGEGGTATINSGGGDDQILVWHSKNVVIDGGTGHDVLGFTTFTGNIPDPAVGATVDLTTGIISNPFGGNITVTGVENIIGTTKADIIIGNGEDNVIGDGFFDGGADQIDARGGNDLVVLGLDSVDVSLDGGLGTDELRLSMIDASLTLDVSDPDNVVSSLGTVTIKGFEIYSVNTDYWPTGLQTFTFTGSDANEIVYGVTAPNTNGQPLIVRDRLNGGGGSDILYGRGGYDRLWGDGDNDTLVGGEGADELNGGTGADTFLYLKPIDATKVGAAHDYVTDFSHAEGDIFDLHAIDANSKAKGNQNFKFIGDNNFHHKAGELHYVVFDTYVEIEGDRNGDGKADFFIAAQNIASLVKGDFHL